jgi:hypothetical protein
MVPFPAKKREFPPLQNLHTDSGANVHFVSYLTYRMNSLRVLG